MAEKKSSGCLKAFVIFTVVTLLVTGVLGGGIYVLWRMKGQPSLAEMQAQMEDMEGGDEQWEAGDSQGASPIPRPVVATAPIMAGPDTYASYVNRSDILTLVNYYSDT